MSKSSRAAAAVDDKDSIKSISRSSEERKLPEVVVLSMNLHGFIEIPLPAIDQVSKLRQIPDKIDMLRALYVQPVPPGMTLIQMRATALGVSNYLSPEDVEAQNNLITKTLMKYPTIVNGIEQDVEVCERFAKDISGKLKQHMLDEYEINGTGPAQRKKIATIIEEKKEDARKRMLKDPKEKDETPEEAAFFHQLISPYSYRVKVYRESQLYTDKQFVRDSEHLHQLDSVLTGELECRIMNVRGSPDVLRILSPDFRADKGALVQDRHMIHLSTILNYLHSMGVKKVIFLDSTCSVIGNKYTYGTLGSEYPRQMNIYDDPDFARLFLADTVPNFPGGNKKNKSKKIRRSRRYKKQIIESLKSKVNSLAHKVYEVGQNVGNKVYEVGQNVGNKAYEVGQNVGHKTYEVGQNVGHKTYEYVRPVYNRAVETAHYMSGYSKQDSKKPEQLDLVSQSQQESDEPEKYELAEEPVLMGGFKNNHRKSKLNKIR
jgi:hypothetical protein